MDPTELRQQETNQRIALFMVVFGACATACGCHFHFAELTALSGGIVGAGINMLTGQIRSTLNNRQGGTVNVNPDPTQAAA